MKSILMAGSSIFELWTTAAELAPGFQVCNRAVGGTHTSYWTEHIREVLAADSPVAVLFYCGSNDLNFDVPPAMILENVRQVRAAVRETLPAAGFAYFGIIKAPQKAGKWELIDRLNADVRAGLPEGDLYVDTNRVFFREGKPVVSCFLEDGLHLTAEGYQALTSFARPLVRTWLDTRGAH